MAIDEIHYKRWRIEVLQDRGAVMKKAKALAGRHLSS